jgi:hypothetical protein
MAGGGKAMPSALENVFLRPATQTAGRQRDSNRELFNVLRCDVEYSFNF